MHGTAGSGGGNFIIFPDVENLRRIDRNKIRKNPKE